MPVFNGFPEGRLNYTSLPDLFFSEYLPLVEDAAELKVVLHIIWLLHRRRGDHLWITGEELASDSLLRSSLEAIPAESKTALAAALRQAVEHGILLVAQMRTDTDQRICYCLNSAKGRATQARLLEQGAISEIEPKLIEQSIPKKTNIFILYEQNIGSIQPIIAEELEEAQKLYSEEWLVEAFRQAAKSNVRRWRYVQAILERWQREGRESASNCGNNDREKYISGEYEEYSKR